MIRHVKDNIIIAHKIMKDLDRQWSPSFGQGGLDEGEKEPHTWYFVFLIKKSLWNRIKTYIRNIFQKSKEDDIFDLLISKKREQPSIPSGYKNMRRIAGTLLTDSKSNIVPFLQKEEKII